MSRTGRWRGSIARHPINAIWEGSGNIMCLDVQRALQEQSRGAGTGARSVSARIERRAGAAAAADRGGLGVAAPRHRAACPPGCRIAAGAPCAGVVVDAYVRTRPLESGARRRYSLERSEIDVLIDRAMGREVSEAVEHALQDPGGSQLVDQLGAAGAARVAVDQHPLDGHRRQPFVPKSKGSASVFEIAGERPCRLGAWPLAAVHIEG